MICINPRLVIYIYFKGQTLTIDQLDRSFTVTFPEKGDDPPTATIDIFNLPDDVANEPESIEALEIEAGFEDNYGVIFQGGIKSHGIKESGDGRSYKMTIDCVVNGTDILKLQNYIISPKETIYSAIEKLCRDQNITLSVFEGDKNTMVPDGFNTVGSFYEVLTRLANAVKCVSIIDGNNIRVELIEKEGSDNYIYAFYENDNSVIKWSIGYDKKKGTYYDITVPLVHDIRKGSNIYLIFRQRNDERRIQGIVAEYSHNGGSNEFLKTKMRIYV